ncbi:MAG: NAD-dependent epimerase/dehydratase family protein [Candidatus Methanomethylicaceae archaeon]
MKVLITGGAGFIGHNVAIRLKNLGYRVIAFDSLKRSTILAKDRLMENGIALLKGDIMVAKDLDVALKSVDVVVHAAAYISVEESIRRPVIYFRNNVAGTASLAEACLRNGVNELIYLSSAAVYGDPKSLPIGEEHPTSPISPYGLSKLMGEEVLKFYAKNGLKYTILRIFNAYGVGQSPSYAGVITRFIESALKGRSLVIYGDGQQTRDFVHVQDVAEAIRLSIESSTKNETFNIGSGKPTKIYELAKTVIDLLNRDISIRHAMPRAGDIRQSYADISKAQRILGFCPTFSLKQGLTNLLENLPKKRP